MLQAVYDQFGDLFLFWRDDLAVHDLRDPNKVQEAAWRLWEAGSAPWLPEVAKADKGGAEHLDKLKGSRLALLFLYSSGLAACFALDGVLDHKERT